VREDFWIDVAGVSPKAMGNRHGDEAGIGAEAYLLFVNRRLQE